MTLQNRTFVALSKSLQFEWSYLQRLIPNIGNAFTPVWNAIYTSFWPAIFDSAISQQDQLLFSIPVKMGGMGIRNPVEMANIAYITSVSGTRYISDAIKERKPFSLVDHNAKMAEAISTMHQQQDHNKLDSVLSTLDATCMASSPHLQCILPLEAHTHVAYLRSVCFFIVASAAA